MFNFLKKEKIKSGAVIFIFLSMFICVATLPTNTASAQVEYFVAPIVSGVTSSIGSSLYSTALSLWRDLVLGISVLLLSIGSLVLWMAGMLLEAVLQYTVVGMSVAVKNGGLGIAITESWRAIRDLANIGFIFILLYVAIGTILGLGSVDMKRMLTRVIIVALLLNFSLFFTKLIIDASNTTTVVFYNAIVEQYPNNATNNSGGISGAFMDKFGFTDFWEKATVVNVIQGGVDGAEKNSSTKMFLLGFFGLIFMLVAAFVFFAVSILFIQRFVALMFVLILSPVAFASMALPKDEYSRIWWKSLLNQAIFAPACMAMMWVTLKLLGGILTNINLRDMGGVIVGQNGAPVPGAGAVIMNFIIVIGFMIGVLIVAKETGSGGASGMLKLGSKWRGNLTSFVGRNTIGRAAAGADKWLAETNALGGRLAGNRFIGTDSRLGRWARSYTTGAVAESKFGGDLSRKTDKARIDVLKKDIANTEGKRKVQRDITEGVRPELPKDVRDLMNASQITAHDDAREREQQKMIQTIGKMSNAELEKLKSKQLEELMAYLKPSQLEHVLEKSTEFTDQEKTRMRRARFQPIDTALQTIAGEAAEKTRIATIVDPVQKQKDQELLDASVKKAKDHIKGLTTKEIETLDTEITALLTDEKFIENLSQGQIDGLTKSDNAGLTASQKQKIKDLRNAPIKIAFTPVDQSLTGPAQLAAEMARANAVKDMISKKILRMGPKDVAKLDVKTVLTDPGMIRDYYTQSILTKMGAEMNPTDIATVRAAITAEAARPGASTATVDLAAWLNGAGRRFF